MTSDPWSTTFLILFIVGLLCIVGTVAMGALGGGDGGHHGGDGADGGDGGDGSHGDGGTAHGLGHTLVTPLLNFSAIFALLMCGGAAGFVMQRSLGAWPVSLGAAVATGYGGGWIMVALIRLFNRMEAGVVQGADLRGQLARVIAPVGPKRMGEIVFSRPDGTRQALPAKADGDEELERDAEVVVLRVQQGTAYVKRLEPGAPRLTAGEK